VGFHFSFEFRLGLDLGLQYRSAEKPAHFPKQKENIKKFLSIFD